MIGIQLNDILGVFSDYRLMQKPEHIAKAFTALSHKRRVIIYRTLRASGAGGLSHGALQIATRLSPMTLSHHLRPMLQAGLVKRKQRGSFAIFSLTPSAVTDVMDSLAAEAALDPNKARAA